MGWTNSHLHQFIVGEKYYSTPHADWEFDVLNEKSKFIYEYDLGDNWEHEILVEKIVSTAEKVNQPVCITGKRACPPEDCGGVWGYEEVLEAIQNPDHSEHEAMRQWLKEGFDPTVFDIEKVNQRLKKLR